MLPNRLVFRDAVDGTELTHRDLRDEFAQRYRAPSVVIHRSDLLDILARAGAFPVEQLGRELDPDAKNDVVVYLGPGCHLVQ